MTGRTYTDPACETCAIQWMCPVTVGQWLIPQLEDAYEQNRVPPLLPMYDE